MRSELENADGGYFQPAHIRQPEGDDVVTFLMTAETDERILSEPNIREPQGPSQTAEAHQPARRADVSGNECRKSVC